ncbi:MAG: SDR family oxidoreductase [Phycisphaeraceae bacterium]|nr:SDR family oxidoreductase [Phycisphaerae bacterium]MBX3392387.1 SDR family oxidoreductase [Phycisphaeraceae bacterium]
MELSLAGRRALVCGSTAGIGRACAVELAALGAEVVLAARDARKLEDVRAGLDGGQGRRHTAIVVDFSDAGSVEEASRALAGDGRPVHVFVSNTGGPPGGSMLDTTEDQLRSAFQSLVLSPHTIARAVVPGMKHAGYGRIITIASTSVKSPIPNLGISNAVRAAAANWSKSLAAELAPFGITVNNVLPGYTETERLASLLSARADKSGVPLDRIRSEAVSSIPAGRFGRADEVAAAVAFLSTPAAAYINGINLPVDGGRLGTL